MTAKRVWFAPHVGLSLEVRGLDAPPTCEIRREHWGDSTLLVRTDAKALRRLARVCVSAADQLEGEK